MAIVTTQIQSSGTTIYTSVGDTALTLISLCNHDIAQHLITINIVPNGSIPGLDNVFISDISIVPADTFIVYQGGEKIILGDGDFVSVRGDSNSVVTAIVSYLAI